MIEDYELIIGLEVYAQLLTESELEAVVESVVQENSYEKNIKQARKLSSVSLWDR